MAQYSNLKAYIEEKIYENGTQAITGDILQDVLKVMTDDLGEFYQMGGVASPSTDPGTPDAKVIYFATEAGTYTNFGGITLAAGEVALLIFETSWTKETLNVLSSANGGVKTANLADGAVTTEKIAGGAVETAKIADNAVTSGKVADGAIGTAKIADGAIDADKIAANAVESAKIKNGAVTEGKINDGAVTAGKVAANAVTTAKIADDAVTTAKLNDGAVTEDKIATDAVTSGKVKDGAIGTAKIAAGAVTHTKIGAGAVEESNIKDGAVTSDKIANGAVGSDQLAEGAFSAQNLADGSVTTDKLADDAVTAEKIADGAVTAGKFANGSVTTIKLGSGAVTTEKIGDGMVTRQKLADSSVGTSKIIDGAVTTDKVADGAITDAKLENPVSVSQNSQTGHTDITIGSTTTPVASVDEISQLGQKADGIFNGLIGEFSQDGLLTYQDFYVGIIPKGTKIVNNSSIAIIVAEDNNLTNRQDIGAYSRVIANSNKSLFRTANNGGNVSLSFILPTNILIDGLGCVAKGAITNAAKLIGYYVERDNTPTYFSISSDMFINPIPIGTIIKNNGVKVGLLGQGSARKDLLNGQSWVTTFEVTDVRTLEVSGNIRLEIDTRNKLLDGADINGNNIQLNSIDINRLSFVKTGINIYNKDSDTGFAEGKFLNQWGGLVSNSDYNTSGFIKVEPNTAYSYIPDATWRFVLEFDENFDAISSTYVQSVRTITTSANTRYIRLTFYANPGKYFLCTGSEPKPYEDYKIFIPSEYIQDRGESSVLFFLPKHIYVANGRTIEIYYNQIMLYAERYNIKATCPIGKALDRKFQIIGDSSHIGNYTLSIVAYDDKDNVVASGTSTIHIVANTISSSKTVLPVGDSLTNDKPWLSELHTLSGNLSTVGTRQEFHEGRSGANVSTYTNVSGGIVYDFDNQFSESGVPTFDDTTPYAIGDKVKIAHTFGNGTAGYRYWIFKQAHTPGAFVESEAYCYSGGNPFYDYVNDKFSTTFYRSFFGKNFDAIVLYLGTNGINLEPETNVNGALGIKNLIELIREDEANTPIVVVNTIFRSSQNGIGSQGNTEGYVAQSEYKYNADKKVLLLARAIEKLCGSMSNVYLCPVGFTHDSKYNFGNTKVQVNPRIDSTDVVYELQPSDSVHPQTSGYLQMADEIFSTLCAVFNS